MSSDVLITPSPADPTLHDRLDVLRRRRYLAALTGLTVFALAAPFVLGLPSLYKANAKVLVESKAPAGLVQASQGEMDGRLQAIKQVALSRERLTALMDRFNLYSNLRKRGDTQAALDRLQQDIRLDVTNAGANPSGQSATIAFTLSYVGRDPQTAADVANTLASFFVAQNDQIRSQQATRATEFLEGQLADTKKRLDAQESRVRDYTARNMGALPQQVDANLAALERLNTQLRLNADEQVRLMERRQSLQSQIAELDNKPPSPDTTSPTARLQLLKKQLSDLQTHAKDAYPDVRSLKAEIDDLEKQVARDAAKPAGATAGASPRTALQTSLDETNARLDKLTKDNEALRGSIGTYEHRVESAPGHQPEFLALMGDYQATRERYDALLKRFGDAQLTERAEVSRDAEEFQILDPAMPPVSANGPSRWQVLLAALVLALASALVAVALAEHWDTSFHSLEELRRFTHVPVLASIPQIRTPRDARVRMARLAVAGVVCVVVLAGLGIGTFELGRSSDAVTRLLLRLS